MAKKIMIQGTMSNAGKSLICAGLCRILSQDGYHVAPFKSQNMALNSYITEDGLEMGRAQAVQAEAAGVSPQVEMNPILLKPTNDTGSQVIVNGQVTGNMGAKEYYSRKKELVLEIQKAFHTLEEKYDIIVIEGAGSPAEINLKQNDIVNMGLAKMVDAPVLLVGDIDRGGVFAQLTGTLLLLEPEEKERIKGLIINKFRGDKSILDPGVDMLEKRTGIPVVGVTPYLNVEIEDEDSLSDRFFRKKQPEQYDGPKVRIAVVKLPRLSNFTDFMLLENDPMVDLCYASSAKQLDNQDMVIVPGTKNTIGDLLWMRQSGMEAAVLKAAHRGAVVWGICGGYQMLGEWIRDPLNTESGDEIRGMGLLPVETVFAAEKTRTRVSGRFENVTGIFQKLQGTEFEGYEIHMGETRQIGDGKKEPLCSLTDQCSGKTSPDGLTNENIYGTYVHGILDGEKVVTEIIRTLADKKNIRVEEISRTSLKSFKEVQYDLLAEALRKHLDMEMIYEILGLSGNKQTRKKKSLEMENILPGQIEKRSFEIISEELEERGIRLKEEQAPIIKRCIHTSADFDYASSLIFSDGAIACALKALREGASIVTDTQMGRAGINKRLLAEYGGEVYCFMSDPDVAEEAKRNGTTRAVASMEKACRLNKKVIFAIGNAPTALIHLKKLIRDGKIVPALIIGVPVGFVNVEAAKEQILEQTKIPYIVAGGRKGGSNIAACICNALLYML